MSKLFEQAPVNKTGESVKGSAGSPDALSSMDNSDLMSALGSSKSMPAPVQAKMEQSFGMSLSDVSLFESPLVSQSGAEAAAAGNKIAFAPGKLDPYSAPGQELLGHEISHVVSQKQGRVHGSGFLKDSALERRADDEGSLAAKGKSVFDSESGKTLSPMSDGSALSGGPLQAKKPEPEELSEAQKMQRNLPFEEEYRPLSQRASHVKPLQRQMDGMDPELLAMLNQKSDNMGDRFELLKKGGDEKALYDFMTKASSLSMLITGFGDYKDDMLEKKDIFNDSLVAMMTDPLFASQGFADHIVNSQNELSKTQTPRFQQAWALHGQEKQRELMGLRADPEFHKFLENAGAMQSLGQIESGFGNRAFAPSVPFDRDYQNSHSDLLHVLWDSVNRKGELSDLVAQGDDLNTNIYNEITAPVDEEQRQLLPQTITNYNTGFETRGTPVERPPQAPAEPQKKSGLGSWFRRKFGKKR